MIKTGQKLVTMRQQISHFLHLCFVYNNWNENTITLNWTLVYICLYHLVKLGRLSINLPLAISTRELNTTTSAADKEF